MKLKNEMPAECITYNFVKGMKIDYFSCSNCKINC